MTEFNTNSPEETERLGECLGELVGAGDLICLNGELGAGKTRIAKGVARGLGVQEPVTSPTFTLIKEYSGRIPLYHMDVYRLDSFEEMEDLGYEEYFFGDGVTLLEWPQNVEEILPGERLDIYISVVEQRENERKILLKGKGKRYSELAEELSENVRAGY